MMKTYIVKVAASQWYDVEVRAETKSHAVDMAKLKVGTTVNTGECIAKDVTIAEISVEEKKSRYIVSYDFNEARYKVRKEGAALVAAYFPQEIDAVEYAKMRNAREGL